MHSWLPPSAFVALVPALLAADVATGSSQLHPQLPAGWTAGPTPAVLLSPGGNAGVTLLPSTAFSGTPDEWMERSWNEFSRGLKLIAGPIPGNQGAFLTRLGHFQKPDGSRRWVIVHTVIANQRGEGLVYTANDEAGFRAHMPALSQMVRALPQAAAALPVSPSTTSPTSRQPSVPEPTLADYTYTAPEGWQVQSHPDHVLLTQLADGSGCRIYLLPPQATAGDLEADAHAAFDLMYRGWREQPSGDRPPMSSRGLLPSGLEFFLFEAPMSGTDAAGHYQREDGAVLAIRLGRSTALVAARHRDLSGHVDCLRRYATWRRFFNSFTLRDVAPATAPAVDPAQRIVGVWTQTESGASSDYVFAANGAFARVGALGTSFKTSDLNYEYLHLKTYAFQGEGRYSLSGNVLDLARADGKPGEQFRYRFEQAQRAGAAWSDRLWLLGRDRFGENEVCFERRNTP